MGFRLPSKTTGPAGQPKAAELPRPRTSCGLDSSCRRDLRRERPDPGPSGYDPGPGHHAVRLVFLLMLATSCLALALAPGCSPGATAVPGVRGNALQPETSVSIDLDGDGESEQVLLEDSPPRITISDGSTVYRSREKWRVVAACLGDTDNDGLPEVVTLLDADDGRHLGLFGFADDDSGGHYRERIVTGVLEPRPLALRIVATGDAPAGSGGDLLVLTEGAATGTPGDGHGSQTRETTYRWNGFGFTALTAPIE